MKTGKLYSAKTNLEENAWALSSAAEGLDLRPPTNLSSSPALAGGTFGCSRNLIQKVLAPFIRPTTDQSADNAPTEQRSVASDVLAFVGGIGLILAAWGALLAIRFFL
jgi:hypothetical protein